MAAGRAVQKNVVSEETEIDSPGVYQDLQVSVSPIISISSHHRVISFVAVLFLPKSVHSVEASTF